jgi:aminoglycoside 3-N-acetyltransferase
VPPNATQLAAQLRQLGVHPGGTLVVHTSFRAIGPVEGGPAAVIQALLQALGGGTLVMPTMTGSRRPEPYDPATTPTKNMGVVAETFWRQPGVLRSDHPTSSFAATGPHAPAITAPQPLEPVHGLDSPIGRVYELDGQVLLLGVGHSVNTTIHIAEALAGVPYGIQKWCTALVDGTPTRLSFRETDHCCLNFSRIGDVLSERGLQTVGPVGNATAILASSQDVVNAALELLEQNPTAFLCDQNTGCEDCDAAWSSIGSDPAAA